MEKVWSWPLFVVCACRRWRLLLTCLCIVRCPYAQILWRAIGKVFGKIIHLDRGLVLVMFEECCAMPCCSQIRLLLISAIVSCFWSIWCARNCSAFENSLILAFVSLRFTMRLVKEVKIF